MTDAVVTLREADRAGLEYVRRLLSRNDLPAADVRASPGEFYVAHADGDRVGVGGLEVYGSVALLRSVVVEDVARGAGYGTAICDALEAEARAAGVAAVYLLTTTAADFFGARGYAVTDRESVPSAIADTSEFADLCPESATCMRKSL